MQRKLKRKVHGLQEEDFQRTQPHSAQTEAGNYQTVNHTFFGGVEPFHRSSTGAGIHKANAVTNQQRENSDEHHWAVGEEAAQDCAAANHQDTSENHFCWANFVLQGAGNNNDKCRNKTANGVGQAELGDFPLFVEPVGCINCLHNTLCIVDRAILKNVLQVGPCIQDTNTEVRKNTKNKNPPGFAVQSFWI